MTNCKYNSKRLVTARTKMMTNQVLVVTI